MHERGTGPLFLKYHNPMALPMVVYDYYGAVQKGELTGRVTLLVHGYAMNHLSVVEPINYGGMAKNYSPNVTTTPCCI